MTDSASHDERQALDRNVLDRNVLDQNVLDRNIEFRPQDLPLKSDVSRLGALVGHMLREQGGDELYRRVEASRRAAIERRESDGAGRLQSQVDDLEPGEAELLVRSFLTYFRVVNLAEQVHRIRRRREYLRSETPQRHSLLDVMQKLKQAGLTLDDVRELLSDLHFEPVFTAHPTEATRRTILEKELRIAQELVRRLDPSLTPPEERTAMARIRDEVTTGWQTDEHPVVRPSVADEMDHVLYHVTEVIYRVVPPFYEALSDALVSVYGDDGARLDLEDLGIGDLVTCASWVGGDMDGNPNVSATTVRATLAEHRRRITGCYGKELRRLARQLSQSADRVTVDDTVHERIDRYAALFPDEYEKVPQRHRDMPYRVLLRLMLRRLQDAEQGYGSADELLGDLRVIDRSLTAHDGEHAGRFSVRRLLRRVRTFGFHLATLDLRQDAESHRGVVAAVLGEQNWAERPAEDRTHRLASEIPAAGELEAAPNGEVERALDVLRAVREAREQGFGVRAIGPFIVSMTQGADDVLTVLLLARWAGLVDRDEAISPDDIAIPLDVAPLFETVRDLKAAPDVLDRLLSIPFYRRHVRRRGDRQVVMIGYSDSNKDGGLTAARWALYTAQSAMAEVLERHGVRPVIFHGRGGTISRGGGKTDRAVLASPRGTVAGSLRVTEQGEVINTRYGLRGIALRTLERAVGSVCLATAVERPVDPREESWHAVMDTVAGTSRATYRQLVWEHPDFVRYFRQATPIDVIERMMIGSRPASRRSRQGLEAQRLEDLRAIPWVFSWTQSRHLLPGWYGLGSGLEQAVTEHGRDAVAEMVADWPMMTTLLEDVEMVLAKSDLDIASRYAALAGDVGEAIFPIIRQEMERTHRWVLDLQGKERLLESDPVLRRSIRLRNPYVDPMSLLQVDLLRRWRATEREDEALLSALLASVHGIAQGLRNTG